MKCPKCDGFMYIERFLDYALVFYGWKCANCGSIIDRTVLDNRNSQGNLLLKAIPQITEVSKN